MELSKNRASFLSGLSQKKQRLKKGIFAAEGDKCVEDTLGLFDLHSLVISEEWMKCVDNDSKIQSFIDNSDNKENVFIVPAKVISKLSSMSTPPGIIAFYHLPAYMIEPSQKLTPGKYLMLDGVRDPGNMGTIIRTAHWFGIRTVFASFDCVDIFNPKTVQSTMGSIAHVDVIYCDLHNIIKNNPEIPSFALMLGGADIYTLELPESAFIVMGNEANGVSNDVASICTNLITIPPADNDSHPESLNVAIATAVTLSAFQKSKYNG